MENRRSERHQALRCGERYSWVKKKVRGQSKIKKERMETMDETEAERSPVSAERNTSEEKETRIKTYQTRHDIMQKSQFSRDGDFRQR